VRMGVHFLLVACVLPAAVHRSFAAEFNENRPMKLDGAVFKFDFMNPHSWIYLDVKEPGRHDGALVGADRQHTALFRRGWCKESLRARRLGKDATIFAASGRRKGTHLPKS
jgi:hypothetical protein